MTTLVLGGGIAGLSLSLFLNEACIILEKDENVGGLCRSYKFKDLSYDVGPHIIFSKHENVLNLHKSMIKTTEKQRLNRILIEGHFVKYPFENHLGMLSADTKEKCVTEFLENPYQKIQPKNMQQFFLNKFGEGMTDVYFSPYNKKIWKFDSSCLDLQMVERIPDPPPQDVIDGSLGHFKEGYTHQLTFSYPSSGGFQSLVDAYAKKNLEKGNSIHTNSDVKKIVKEDKTWVVHTKSGIYKADNLVSTLPLNLLPGLIQGDQHLDMKELASRMLYNSIHIVILQFRGDKLKDQFALYVPDDKTIFHRISRLNFLGPAYGEGSDVLTLMLEITFRPESYLSKLSSQEIMNKCIEDLDNLGLTSKTDFIDGEVRTFPYAYVIYDLQHRERTNTILEWANKMGIMCHGRFGKFEYQNSDQVVFDSILLAEKLNSITL